MYAISDLPLHIIKYGNKNLGEKFGLLPTFVILDNE